MSKFVKVAKIGDIPEGSMKGFEVGYDRILVCHTAKGWFALTDECSHDSAPISGGELRGQEVVCPRHGARFNIETGEVAAPPAVVGIDPMEIKIENDEVFVKVE
ncbi:MAG TPA: Rieske 2Fe-2S domain-containing protein [candidate division Zixibacteria bacterium]|nr:Rieske 2Fe-2S domain-containing protein [candidate division Zixibacteria bacterium]